ncbi:MAG: toxin RelG [Candidatus Mesenet longicola]|uniref:Toxin RelG n=1 Tax=Candidatus Mesenet longicola TaxID=1892558 RepID=A0A8J3MPD2_9RICK|nr:MAG: toxin RelG [Candidatus Mesenet longicola]GHM59913.1 MAG: toxin RelG [Candidatus Mesenet longicola]
MKIKHYRIKFLKHVTERDLPALPVTIELRVKKAIDERLTIDPINLGEPLHYSFKGHRRLRVGDYRILYRVDKLEHTVIITEIGHRDAIYKR